MAGREVYKNPDEGRMLRVVADSVRVLVDLAETGGAYEVFEFHSPQESGPPPHTHPWNEAYIMLAGEVEFTINESKMIATPGCFINIPGGTLHAYRILTDGAKFILITNPAGAGDFFTELDRETGGSVDNLEKIVRIAVQHGFTVPAPPAA